MSTVSRTFTVTKPPNVVVPYLADFANAEKWDPGTVKCIPTQPGPVQVGSAWQNTSKLFGVSTELVYTLEELTESKIVLVGRNKTATSTERIEVTPSGSGSRVVYVNDTEFNGAAKLAAPLVRLLFERLAGEVESGIKDAVDGLPG